MLLVIDAGNTNITFGVFRGADLLAQWRLTTDRERSSEEYEAQIQNAFTQAGIDREEIEAVVIASVVPPLNEMFKRVVVDLTPLFVDYTTYTGLKILYDSPAELGADRVVDAVAAVAKYGAPCIVVDFGTATTFNAVNEAKEYLGGVIAPGLMISAEALFSRAAKLPRVDIRRPDKVIGTSTVEAMQSGLYHGYAGLVDGVLEKMIAEMKTKPHVVATGGLAPLIVRASKFISEVDETLTLEGLRLIHERSKAHEQV